MSEIASLHLQIKMLQIKCEELEKHYFQPFSFVIMSEDIVIDVYKNNLTAINMFTYFVKKYYIREKCPNIYLKEKRNGTYRCYDGETFSKIILKHEIIQNVIMRFAIFMSAICRKLSSSFIDYKDLFDNQEKYEQILTDINEIILEKQPMIKKYYMIFESAILNHHKNLFV